ncbi:hypothetical protein [Arachidicoccus sp.]|uniref:hypothetical protein n=1 Tax=Arachidicoccus sp. TaxID=1872624 RepID=UPI003D214EFE
MTEINKLSTGDYVNSAVRAGLGVIPMLGPVATEMWNLLFTPPLEKRKIAFLEELAQRINALEESDKVDINQLVNNDTFIDILASITDQRKNLWKGHNIFTFAAY